MVNVNKSAGGAHVSDSTGKTGKTAPSSEGFGLSSFSCTEVVLVHAGDTGHCGGVWDETGIGCYQGESGPTFLVIGRLAGEDQLRRAADRFRCQIDDLRAFRSGDGERREARCD